MKKPLFAAFMGLVFGLALGYQFAARVFFPKLAADARLAAHSIDSEQRFATVLSLAALAKLEQGRVDDTKSFLASNIASYAHSSFDASLPENERLARFIAEASEKYPVLKEKLETQQK